MPLDLTLRNSSFFLQTELVVYARLLKIATSLLRNIS